MSHEGNNKRKREHSESAQSLAISIQTIQANTQPILDKINDFIDHYLPHAAEVEQIVLHSHMRMAEMKLGMFTPAVSGNHLVIERLKLLYKQSAVLTEIYALNTEINDVLRSPDMHEFPAEQEKMIHCRETFCAHVVFIGSCTRELVNLYHTTKDDYFKADVRRRLEEHPKLLRWLQPFLTREHNDDPLFTAVRNRIEDKLKRKRLDRVEIIKGAFDSQVRDKLVEFESACDLHLMTMEAYDEPLEAAESVPYADKIQIYANYCATVLKDVLKTIDSLSSIVAFSDKCIREIQKVDESVDTTEMVRILAFFQHLKDELANEVYITDLMREPKKNYADNEKNLTPNLKAFMRPWLNDENLMPLQASIDAYENPEVLPEKNKSLATDGEQGKNLRQLR